MGWWQNANDKFDEIMEDELAEESSDEDETDE